MLARQRAQPTPVPVAARNRQPTHMRQGSPVVQSGSIKRSISVSVARHVGAAAHAPFDQQFRRHSLFARTWLLFINSCLSTSCRRKSPRLATSRHFHPRSRPQCLPVSGVWRFADSRFDHAPFCVTLCACAKGERVGKSLTLVRQDMMMKGST